MRKSSLSAVSQFWPGATSVVIPAPEGLASLHLGRRSLAVRIPDDHQLIGLLEKTGPLMTTSANRPGETPAATVEVAQSIFGHEVDFYVDGGDLSDHQPSTIIRVVDDAIEILRSGAVKIDETGRIIE